MSTESRTKFLNRKDLIAYFLVAGTGAIVQLVCSSLIQDWFDLTLTQSVWPSYIVSFGVGFVLTKFFAFDARRTNQTRREMVKFVMVAIFSGFVMDLAVRFAVFIANSNFDLIEYQIPHSKKIVDVTGLICYVFGMGCSFISNYTLHKTFTFQSTGFYDRLKTLIK
ncbi:GtrA family protein [Cytophagaceae bacterium SJW1-29]|uniref:GtrA family protein n=2 Tax=Salmonirosea aquatica TaxID=2654236 RepID=A0A7C9FR68_9BACT|nr:GtrA family protein [Cytophagaceae bacterium SJW1-29]